MHHPSKLILHGVKISGHVHRVELLLSILGLPHEFVVAPPEVRASDAFRRLNPMGQIPVLQDGELVISDSNAILVYLVKRYAPESGWLPDDAAGAAAVQRWFSLAAGEIAFGPANARGQVQFKAPGDPARAAAIAARVLGFMDQHLGSRAFLAAERATLADIACYAYVAHAPEGGVALDQYPALRAWLARVEALPGFIALAALPLPVSPLPAAP